MLSIIDWSWVFWETVVNSFFSSVKSRSIEKIIVELETVVDLARDEDHYVVLNKENVLGRKVLLCDDILTTGSTIKECAIALFNSGASEVLAVCIANRK